LVILKEAPGTSNLNPHFVSKVVELTSRAYASLLITPK